MVGVLLGCVSVVPTTLRESTILMPDFEENKQADAGSRLFWKAFSCGALVWNYPSAELEEREAGLSTHTMCDGNVLQNPSCAASCH